MNQTTKIYWENFQKTHALPPNTTVSAWQFGAASDNLVQLVLEGKKTATCSAQQLYDIEDEMYPRIGAYNIILNSEDLPVCITRTTSLALIPMNEVTDSFAHAEGEGDQSHAYWHRVHTTFFQEAFQNANIPFTEDILLICETFKVVDKNM